MVNRTLEETVYTGGATPGHPADDIMDKARAGEGGAFTRVDVEFVKAVEKIATSCLAQCIGNLVVRAGYHTLRSKAAICGYFRERDRGRTQKKSDYNELYDDKRHKARIQVLCHFTPPLY